MAKGKSAPQSPNGSRLRYLESGKTFLIIAGLRGEGKAGILEGGQGLEEKDPRRRKRGFKTGSNPSTATILMVISKIYLTWRRYQAGWKKEIPNPLFGPADVAGLDLATGKKKKAHARKGQGCNSEGQWMIECKKG